MPDGPVGHHPGPYAARGAGPRARAPSHVNGNANGNAFKVIEEKFAALAVEVSQISLARSRGSLT